MLLEFLGGAAFRMIWGEVAGYLTKYQDHKHELAMISAQDAVEKARADRQMEQQRLAADLQVRVVEIQRDADVMKEEAAAFKEAMKEAWKPSGITWVDAWNGAVRPAFATTCLCLWALILHQAGWAPDDWDRQLIGGIVGFFFADRSLGRRGK